MSSTTITSNTITVQLSRVSDQQTVTIEVDSVARKANVNPKVLVSMSVLIGDVNQSGAVTAEDVALIQANTRTQVITSNFTCDVNVNGLIDGNDVSAGAGAEAQDASLFPDFAFTGHYYHARSGLYLALYRAYNPTIGRWLSRDPIEVVSRLAIMPELLPEGPNVYRFVANNAVNNVDFLGLQTSDCRCKDGSRLPLFQCWTQPNKALQKQGWNIWQGACEIAQESCQATCCATCFSNDPLELCPRFCTTQYLLCIRGGGSAPIPPNPMPHPPHPPRLP